MIIAILGLSGSGKDTICNAISKDLDIPKIISHTTRPPRSQEEIDNDTYHFVSNDFFENEKDNFIEQRTYEVKTPDNKCEIWRYGIHKDSIKDDVNLVIVDPPGLYDLENYFGKPNIIPFYIHCSDEIRMQRLAQRGDTKNLAEVKRRQHDDNLRFKDFIEKGDYYKIHNEYKVENAINEMEYILIKNVL